jgi:hypothetical protein
MKFDKEALKVFTYWITERERIRQRKEAAQPRPWTKDTILDTYRFCNVNRNDDRVTRWIHQNWLHPHAGDPNLWFAMVVARLLNLPASLNVVEKAVFGKRGVHWQPMVFTVELIKARQTAKVFNAAYIVSTNGHAMDKVRYLEERVLTPLWEKRADAEDYMTSLNTFHQWLMQFDGMGSFMAAQVVGDIKYDERSPLNSAEDFHTWAASGPGSRRGMNRLCGQPANAPLNEKAWRVLMEALLPAFPDITAQNLQNCLCEFDKYMRVKLGEGTPKQHYKPQEN